MVALWHALLALPVLAACGGALEAECAAPARLSADGRCLEPGVDDKGCAAGEFAESDGSCTLAGIPPESCASGFVGAGLGCEPTLPPEPCPSSTMAVPGETSCHPVAPCAAGTWGDIPVEPSTQFVNAAYRGGTSDGTELNPWTTITEAVAAAAPGAIVAVAAGDYVEDVLVADKPVRIWGVCPDLVELRGIGAQVAALTLVVGSSGSELRSIALSGASTGLGASGAEQVLAERVLVHDALDRGIGVEDAFGPTSLTLRASLVEGNRELGIFVGGAELDIENSVVRRSLPRALDELRGRGINAQRNPASGRRATLFVRGSLLEENHDFGVFMDGSDATIEASVIRGTVPESPTGLFGRGIGVQEDDPSGEPSNLTLRGAVVEENHDVGLSVGGSVATIDASVVRTTLPRLADQRGGRGVSIGNGGITGAPASATLSRSLVDANHDIGVLVLGSDATIEASVVRATAARPVDGLRGRGIAVEDDEVTGTRASARVRGSVVEDSYDAGVFVIGAEVQIETTAVRRTAPQVSNGLYGDGLVVMWRNHTSVTIAGCLVEHNTRAGVAIFGAAASIKNSRLGCNALDLVAEAFAGVAANLLDEGGNSCGCTEPASCLALAAGIEPPDAVE